MRWWYRVLIRHREATNEEIVRGPMFETKDDARAYVAALNRQAMPCPGQTYEITREPRG